MPSFLNFCLPPQHNMCKYMFDYCQFCMTSSLEKLFHMDIPYPSEILACFSTHCKTNKKAWMWSQQQESVNFKMLGKKVNNSAFVLFAWICLLLIYPDLADNRGYFVHWLWVWQTVEKAPKPKTLCNTLCLCFIINHNFFATDKS